MHLEAAVLLLATQIAVGDPSNDLPEHTEARQMAARRRCGCPIHRGGGTQSDWGDATAFVTGAGCNNAIPRKGPSQTARAVPDVCIQCGARARIFTSLFAPRKAVAAPQLQFFDIVAGWPGSVHDSRIFDNSRLRVLYERNRVPGVLLSNAGYECQPYLFIPFSEPGTTDAPKERYQKALIKTRNVVERAFGMWKRRFPCLDMGMQHKAKNIVHIITACAALHNLACLLREPEPPAQRVPQPSPISTVATRTVHLPPVDHLTDSRSGNQAQDLLIRKSFT
ncbi:hypothetical protein MRX96_041647 [Rhipicephalus microplus]